jgi:3-oxoacyl-[acyl-carrier-protein] synthase II
VDNIAITGMGVISSLGQGVAEFAENLAAGHARIVPAPWADPENGEHSWVSSIEAFDAEAWLGDDRVVRGTDLFTQYALAAAIQAVEDSGLELDPLRTGVVLGTSMSGAGALMEAQRLLTTEGPHAVPRKLQLSAWANAAAGQIAMRWKLHGPLLTISTACASSLDAIGTASRLIEAGVVDVVITGGTDSAISETLHHSQVNLGMAESQEDPRRATMPFDVNRSGIVIGEGAAIVVLERASRARERGARVHGLMRGYGSRSDAYHPSAPDPSGRWQVAAMEAAHRDAGVTPSDVDALVAHATSTPKGDLAEITSINEVFGEDAASLLVSSLKGAVGHTAAASGAMGLVAGLHGMVTKRFIPTANTTDVDPAARFTVVTGTAAEIDVGTLQVNSFGFGGQNASIVVSSPA